MSDTKTVTFKVVREETWFPEYEVPGHMDDEEVLKFINHESPDAVFDEYLNKYTLDTEFTLEIVEAS